MSGGRPRLADADMEYRGGIPYHAPSAEGDLPMAASAPVRHCVICKRLIPEARLLVSPKTITCSPEHSRRHKQNLINALRRRQRAEGR